MADFYIIKSRRIDRYYVGSCDDKVVRLRKHNSGSVRSTKAFRPWKLVYSESYKTTSEARKREKQIKSWKSKKMVEKIISLSPSSSLV